MSGPPAFSPADTAGVRGWRSALRRLGLLLLLAGIGAVAVGRLRYQAILVVGSSMEPTFHSGDLLLLDRAAYGDAAPRRNDIVVLWHRGERIVKRVVGLPGEDVEVRRSHLYVDGRRFSADHRTLPGFLEIRRGHLAADRYAMLGDNRSMSAEETVHAVVGTSALIGRVAGRISWRDRCLERLTYPEAPGDPGLTLAVRADGFEETLSASWRKR